MMKISTKMLTLSTLMLSTMMVINSENWFSMWMGLEINMMSFIPMMKELKNLFSPENMMTYFLIQSMSSIMLVFSIIMTPMLIMTQTYKGTETNTIIMLSMMMKMGMAPMHMWFINILNKMNWNSCMMLMTWQKIAPMFILSNMTQSKIMIIMSMTSAIIGAIGGLNQTSIKKILGYSSVNHMGWMMICLKFDNEMWIKYLITYMLMIILITKLMKSNSIQFINQMNMNTKTNTEKMNIMISLLSLGGLPPFIGFLPKWLVMQSMISNNLKLEMTILLFSSMITLFYYMRMMSPIIMMFNTTNKWNVKKTPNKIINMMMINLNMMLPVVMMINLI